MRCIGTTHFAPMLQLVHFEFLVHNALAMSTHYVTML